MKILKFVPIKLTLFLVLGILFGHFIPVSIYLPFSIVLFLLFSLGLIFVKEKSTHSITFGVLAVLLTFTIGFLAITIANPKNKSSDYSKFSLPETQELHLKITEVLKTNDFSNRYIAEITSLNGYKTSGNVLLTITLDSSLTILNIDEEITSYKKLNTLNSPLNPHEFNYQKYLEGLGIHNQLYLKSTDFILNKEHSRTLYGIAANWRTIIIQNLKKENIEANELGIIQALLLGERNDISEETYTNYKNAGAIHILAVSGLHIGILLLLLQFLLRPLELLPAGKHIKLVLIVVLLWCFAFLAGLSPSVVRAVTMFSFLAYAVSLNRPANKFNILALSMFFILLIKPSYLFQVGFQMSYAAVFAILWIYPLMQRFWFPKNRIIRYIWQLLSVSTAAQLGVLPISLFYFHQFPGLFFVANLIIIPFLGLILAFGILVIILSLLNILPSFISKIYNEIIMYMNTIVEWIAQQEAFIFRNISFDGVQLLLLYTIIIAFIIALIKPSFKRIAIFLIGLIALQLWLLFTNYKTLNKEELLVVHQSRNTGILYKSGVKLHLLSSIPEKLKRFATSYKIAERTNLPTIDSLKNSYYFADKGLYIIDSFAIYPTKEMQVEYLLLIQSPKLNLERLLDSLNPKMVIADGSNFKSDIAIWNETCVKRKLPFHYTGEKGAYYFKLND
jgi:competence protein ComEC